MDRKWSALCAALVAAHTFLQAGAADVLLGRLRTAAETGRLAAAALTLEMGMPREKPDWLSTLPAGEGEGPFAPPEEPSPDSGEPSPPEEGEASARGGSTPAAEGAPGGGTAEPPAETPGPTEEPAAEERPETSAPAGDEPSETAAEVLPFTDTPGVEIKNNTGFSVDISALMAEELTQRLPASGPQILILHTHGTEAYLPVPGEGYEASDPYRTTDPAHSVIRVGDVLQSALEGCGLTVIHDRSLYDYPSYTGSYARSEEAVERWLAQYPDIAIVIDLHRDAVGTDEVVYKTCARVSGESAAQVMLVVGTGENGLEHPFWRENLKLALAMQAAMDSAYPTLTRPIHLARERYNQHLTRGSLILEVGTNGNTLSEAERAVELFARAVGPLLASLRETE